MFKKGLLTGVLLFGLFFGAGNLIFPPNIGVLSGDYFIYAISGFIVSAVGLATFTLIVSLFTGKGYQELMSDLIHPKFALVYLVALYLTIGPLFAIPRTATTSFSIGIEPVLANEYKGIGLSVFAIIYFAFTYWLAVSPTKLLDRIGKVLTPLFAGMIVLIIILGLQQLPHLPMNVASIDYSGAGKAFGSGVLEGYNTLDALAAVAFSVVAMDTLKTFEFKTQKDYKRTILFAGVSVASLFSVLYVGLALLGNYFKLPDTFKGNVGTYILSEMTQRVFGPSAQVFLAVMVIVTCLTTTVGLVVSISKFFNTIYTKFTYITYVRLFCLLGFIISNFGLDTIISLAVPVLLVLYPITIVIALLVCLHQLVTLSKVGIRLTMGIVTILSFLQVLSTINGFHYFKTVISLIPYHDIGVPWLLPAVVGVALAIILPYQKITKFKNNAEEKK
ncbi:branched-chain amino acid transport system II carrier protein [Carnobacteriaceae bacterium zg-ZUI240]|nr:branched-chain amino acid transport system II carrier protein [Carnobacteriaceae bacterium zg-ZUI240]